MKLVSGFTSTTPTKLLLGAGAFFKNYDPTTDTPETASAKLVGATQGGGSFSAVPTVRNVAIDGVKGNVKGMQVIDDWAVTLVSNVKEISVDAIKLALGAATSATSTAPANYTKITGDADIETTDYLTNLTWVGTISGSDNPVIIVVKNALSINGLSISVADKNEAVIPITITGNYAADALEEAPFEIYYPTIS